MPTYRYPGATTINPVATDYVISFIRKREDFPVNRYVQLVEAPAPSFFYYKLERDQMVRQHNINEAVWKDGADRPIRTDNQIAFTEVQAFTVRYDYNTRMGYQAVESNKHWKAKEVHLQALGAQCMLGRTYNVVNLLDTVANWPTTNTADANTLNQGAGQWHLASDDPADANYNSIRKSLMKACTVIFSQTNGRVKWSDLRLLLSPDLARVMANTAELHNYIRQTPAAVSKIEGDEDDYEERFGLPRRLFGLEVVIENTMYVNDLPSAGLTTMSTNRQFIKDNTKAQILSRPGKIDGVTGPAYSTVQVYYNGAQVQVEEFDEPKHRYVDLHVSDEHVATLPAGEAGYCITSVVPSNIF